MSEFTTRSYAAICVALLAACGVPDFDAPASPQDPGRLASTSRKTARSQDAAKRAVSSSLRYDDLPEMADFVKSGYSWSGIHRTYFIANNTGDISGDAQRDLLQKAIALWSSATPLRFHEASDESRAEIVIRWGTGDHGDGHSFDGTNGVLAHAFYPPGGGGSLAGDIHFDDDELWTSSTGSSSSQPIDLLTVAAHELGHALGLNHSGEPTALMYSRYGGSHRYLADDDIMGIHSIYGYNTKVVHSAVFDWRFYVNNNPDLWAAGIRDEARAQRHWLIHGISEARQAHPSFHSLRYLALYSDLQDAYGDNYWAAINHYVEFGIREGRSGL